MAALLKKRALAEYCSYTTQEETARPIKRLQIVKRSKSSEQCDFDLSTLDYSTHPSITSTLQSLLVLSQALPLSQEIRGSVVRKLLEFLQEVVSESDPQENASSLRPILISKLFSILPKVISAAEVQNVLDKVISITQQSASSIVISHGVHAAFVISTSFTVTSKQLDLVLQLALTHLRSTSNYLVKVHCLEALGGLNLTDDKDSAVVEATTKHSLDQDNRVRTSAFNALLELQRKDAPLPAKLYDSVCSALEDDYRCVRESALYLIVAMAERDPDRLVCVQGSNHRIRLMDHAFSQICNSVNDVSVRVRTLAVSLLGSLPTVSDLFLRQTLDKKIMSNMRKRSSAHEVARVMASSGEWATGKRWAEDLPMEEVDAEAVQIISSGACGAFVHGLEDEFLEVRTASLESICRLARQNCNFANHCLDFLVDMFNDEIEDVRLKAIQVLQDIAHHIKLRPDQLEEILHALKDSWLDIRESLHTLLATCKLCTTTCVTSAVSALLDNLRRYPQDKRSIHRCLKQIGINHPELVLALVPQLLLIHPYFDGVEPSVQDSEYICKLILVLNAAARCPTILPLLEQHTLRHYAFLRDSMPQVVPHLKFDEEESSLGKEVIKTNTASFLAESLQKVARLERSGTQFRLTIYATVQSDLEKLADIDPSISPAASMAALHIQCLLLFTRVLATRNWLTPSSLSVQQSGALRTTVDQLLRNTLRLRYAFSNLSPAEAASVRSLRVRALALQLVYVVHGSTGSALGLCDNFLEHIEAIHKYLLQQNLPLDSFLDAVVQELSQLEEPRPGAVARILQPLLIAHKVIPVLPFTNPTQVKMAWAEILEPAQDGEGVYKLGAGLVVGVQLDAELWHVPDLSCLRIRLIYPDHSSHLIIPNRSDLRVGEAGCVRLLTTVLVSAQVWSEACQVGISLVLDTSEQEALGGRRHALARTDDGATTTVQLCSPVKVLVWPKAIRKNL